MMNDAKKKTRLLKDVLGSLLREWGYHTVRECLEELHSNQSEDSSLLTQERKPRKEYRRRSASEIIELLDITGDRKEVLRSIATRFDEKSFLPTNSDVRHFLEMRGYRIGSIKQRQDSFKKLLEVLISMEDDELLLLQGSGTYSGPTKLGPLSDAIKATSAAVRGPIPSMKPRTPQSRGEAKGVSVTDTGDDS